MTPDWDSQHSTFYDDYTHVKPWTRKGLQNALRMQEFLDVNCIYFKQLPILWRYPCFNIFSRFISLLPESYKWKNKEERLHRKWVRFSKEKMLLAHATKQKT